MKKKAAIIFTVLMLALTAGLTGCGRNDVDTPDAGDNNVTEEERKAGDAGSLNEDVVENGDIAVVLVNGYDATLKKFTKNGDVVVLEPMSNDPSFQTQIYTKETPIKIIGKYIGKMEMK